MGKLNICVLVRSDGTVERTEMSGYAAESTVDQMVYNAEHHAPEGRYLFGVHIELYGHGLTGRRRSFSVGSHTKN